MLYRVLYAIGERCLEYGSDTLQADILINPRLKTLVTRLRSFLVTPSSYRHLIYSGPALQKTGCWILQDSLFTFAVLADIFRGADVCNAIRAGHVRKTEISIQHIFIVPDLRTQVTCDKRVRPGNSSIH